MYIFVHIYMRYMKHIISYMNDVYKAHTYRILPQQECLERVDADHIFFEKVHASFARSINDDGQNRLGMKMPVRAKTKEKKTESPLG